MIHSPSESATLVEGAIERPDEPRHFMVICALSGNATARLGNTLVASSERALLLKEVGRAIYEPVVYFPPGDVRGELMEPSAKTTSCPLKGRAHYFNIAADEHAADAAWSYKSVLDFDPRLKQIQGCIAFDRRRVTVERSESHKSARSEA